jgi:hypothetical protein
MQRGSNQPPRLFAWIEAGREYRPTVGEIGRIVEFNPGDGRILRSYDAGATVWSCVVDWRGPPEILCTDRKGFLHVLDADLILKAKVQVVSSSLTGRLDEVRLYIDAVTNIVGKAGKQLVLHSSEVEHVSGDNPGSETKTINVRKSHRNTIRVLDSNLISIGTYEVADLWSSPGTNPGWSVRVADWDGDGVQEIISLTDKVTVLKYNGSAR